MKSCLDYLYDAVIRGYVIVDDYGEWEGCQKAVDDSIKERNLKIKLGRTDYTEYCFQKPQLMEGVMT